MNVLMDVAEKAEVNVEQMTWRQEFERIAQQMREEARAAGVEEMSMEEIDAIIAECRQEMRQKQG